MLAEDRVISKEAMCGFTNDASSRGAREELAEEMNELNLCFHMPIFAVTCVLRDMNQLMQYPCEKLLGDGGIV